MAAQIKKGETVPIVRSKLGIKSSEYDNAWSALNRAARTISSKHYGTVSAKKAGIVAAADELKDYFRLQDPTPLNDEKIGHKLVEVLKVDGAAAWLISTAQKRVHDQHLKDAKSAKLSPQGSAAAAKVGSSAVAGGGAPKTFDPIKDI